MKVAVSRVKFCGIYLQRKINSPPESIENYHPKLLVLR